MMIIAKQIKKGFFGFQRRHLIFLLGFLLIFTISEIIFVSQNDAFIEAKRFARDDPQVRSIIGPVSKVEFGIFNDWSIDGSSADFMFDVTSQNHQATLEIHLYNRAGVWKERIAYLSLQGDRKIYTITPAAQ